MLQPNFTEKALVPYVPQKTHRGVFDYFNTVFASANGAVFLFLCLFFVVSVFARCISSCCPDVVQSLLSDIAANGSFLSQSWKLFAPVAVAMALSFLAGFTSLSTPVSLVSALVYFYRFSFVCFALLYDGDRLRFVFQLSAVSLCGVFYHAFITYFEGRNTFLQRVMYTFLCCALAALTVFSTYTLLK